MSKIRKICLGALCVASSLLGCSKAPEPLVEQAAKAPPQEVTELAGSSLPLEPTPPEAVMDASGGTLPVLQFTKPETQAAVADYQQRWQQLQQDTQAGQNLNNVDPLTNPQAILDYAGKIGADANQLDAAERAARRTMQPEEKKRFKALQKELAEPNED